MFSKISVSIEILSLEPVYRALIASLDHGWLFGRTFRVFGSSVLRSTWSCRQ